MIVMERFSLMIFTMRNMSRLVLVLVGLIFVAAGTVGCQSNKTSDRSVVSLTVDEAGVAVEGENRLLRGRTSGVWVDARTTDEFRKERIPGAIHLPLERARDEHRMLRGYDTVVVYDRDRASHRATALSKLLMELGHRNVRTLEGGFAAWKDAGKPIEQQ